MSDAPHSARGSATPARIAALAAALAIVVAGKTYYRHASAGELAWLIAPTARCASALTGAHFRYAADIGWIDRSVGIAIVPACAGLHFLLCALLVLLAAAWSRIARWRDAALALAGALAAAYVATIAVDSLRIALAVPLHDAGGGADAHALEGTIVYFGGLCLLYALGAAYGRAARPTSVGLAALATRGRTAAVPIAAYALVVLVLPIVNGASARIGFAHHLLIVLVGIGVVAASKNVLAAARRIANTRQGGHE